MLLGSLAEDRLIVKCFDCGKAATNECIDAKAMVPTSGPADNNANSIYTSVNCHIGYYPKEYKSTDFSAISEAAQSLVDLCCIGNAECAGVAYGLEALHYGCVCIGMGACQCGQGAGTPVCRF